MNSGAVTGRWSALVPRVLSALAMVAIGVVEIWIGGRFFHVFVGLMAALMLWELVRMLAPRSRRTALVAAVLGGLWIIVLPELPLRDAFLVPLAACVVAAVAVGLSAGDSRRVGVSYAMLILLGAYTLMLVRDNLGFSWILWLICVVIASDVMGYFAGKTLGGPKFWPSISPKKTWSGTIAGWIGAACIGAAFGANSGVEWLIIGLSVLLAFTAQMGDIAESAIKRRSGVKDSSSLIPGHNGVLDRFDGLLGAAVALFILAAMTGLPEGVL